MTDTELLRRAARHIRYLAGNPADWAMDSTDWQRFTVYEDHGIQRTTIAESPHPTLSVHVATWDPAVAHLVADWLESEADLWGPSVKGADDHAHRVARALLAKEA